MKLSRLSGTSITYWLNLQKSYDTLIAEFESDRELEEEKKVFGFLDYKYFRTNFKLKDYPRNRAKQIVETREFLKVSTLRVLSKKDMAASFRSKVDISEAGIVKANAMVQIATNITLGKDAPKYDKKKFDKAVGYALSQTTNHRGFLENIKKLSLKLELSWWYYRIFLAPTRTVQQR